MSCRAIQEITRRELDDAHQSVMTEWLEDRPQVIRDRAEQLPPMSALLFTDGSIGFVFSYQEDGGITFSFHTDYDDAMDDRQRICRKCLDKALARLEPLVSVGGSGDE